jgi:hypothetical protein
MPQKKAIKAPNITSVPPALSLSGNIPRQWPFLNIKTDPTMVFVFTTTILFFIILFWNAERFNRMAERQQ